MLDSGALQPRKWQLTGIDCSTTAQASGSPQATARANGQLGPQYAASRHTTPHTSGLFCLGVIRAREGQIPGFGASTGVGSGGYAGDLTPPTIYVEGY